MDNIQNNHGSSLPEDGRNNYDRYSIEDSHNYQDSYFNNDSASINDGINVSDVSSNDDNFNDSDGSSNDSSISDSDTSSNDDSINNSDGSSNDGSISDSDNSSNDDSISDSNGSSNDGSINNSHNSSNDDSINDSDDGSPNDGNLNNSDTSSNDGSINNSDGSSSDGSINDSNGSSSDGSINNSDTSSNDGSINNSDNSSSDGSINDSDDSSNGDNLNNSNGSTNDGSINDSDDSSNDSSINDSDDSSNDDSINDSDNSSTSNNQDNNDDSSNDTNQNNNNDVLPDHNQSDQDSGLSDNSKNEDIDIPAGSETINNDIPEVLPDPAPLLEIKTPINEILPLPRSEKRKDEYTFCSYSFYYDDQPLCWKMGDDFSAEDELPDTVELYLDGPEGHVDDSQLLEVEWDLSEADFNKAGSYTVTGFIDTSSCEYPVDWDDVPLPVLIIEIVQGGTLSYQYEFEGDTLVLSYEMNGEPFTLSDMIMSLYESTDDGSSWNNISQSIRVRISDNQLSISGVTSDSLFQAIDLYLPDVYESCSDIVEVEADSGIRSVNIIPSGGLMGGGQWGDDSGSIWNPDPVEDGPYQILRYKTGNAWPLPLDLRISKEDTDLLPKDFYNYIYVYYGDEPGGFWEERVRLPVQWDWETADAIDRDQTGVTTIHGKFSADTVKENHYLLDFDHMPELSFTITVYSPNAEYSLNASEEKLFDDNTVQLQFYDSQGEPMTFGDISGLTVWCSIDNGDSWYNITHSPNVELTPCSLSVSRLKEANLRGNGYTFEIEQTSLPDHDPYSSSLNIFHGLYGIYFSPDDIGGERGGGKRYEKAPEGLFDLDDPDGDSNVTTPPGPDEPEHPGNGSDTGNEPDTEEPDTPSTGPGSEESRPAGGGSDGGSSGNNSSTISVPAVDILPEADPAESDPPLPVIMPAAAAEPETSSHVLPSEKDYESDRPDLGSGSFSAGSSSADPDSAAPGAAGSEYDNSISQTPPDTLSEPDGALTSQSDALDASTDSEKPAPASRHDVLRRIAAITSVFIGGAAGFFMIRRR